MICIVLFASSVQMGCFLPLDLWMFHLVKNVLLVKNMIWSLNFLNALMVKEKKSLNGKNQKYAMKVTNIHSSCYKKP